MKYIVFFTKNKESKINGVNRIYVGVHKVENASSFDGYIGEGVKIQQVSTFMYPKTPFQFAVKKYGVKSFERTILFMCDTAEEAYQKEQTIITEDFVNQSFVYNLFIKDRYEDINKPLYQFDHNGKLIKKWDSYVDCCDFYGYPKIKFDSARTCKYLFLNSYWSFDNKINAKEYLNKTLTNTIYLYKNGKLIREFINQSECAKFLNCTLKELLEAIKRRTSIQNYFISTKVVDEFISKPRNQYIKRTFHVYENDNYLGKFIGKKLMKIINLHSWFKIDNIFTRNNGWYKNFYISFDKVDKIPKKQEIYNGIAIDVYDKYGNFIEHLDSIKKVKEKYQVPAAKIKNIQQGQKFFGDYIFKYSK